jgi:hypothetical protein
MRERGAGKMRIYLFIFQFLRQQFDLGLQLALLRALRFQLLKKSREVEFTIVDPNQGWQMVNFQTKNPNVGKFWRELKMLVYFKFVWNIYGNLVYVFNRH